MPVFLGIMSGTSLDGIDVVALEESAGEFRTIGRSSRPFTPDLRRRLLELASSKCSVPELDAAGRAAADLASQYALAVEDCLSAHGIPRSRVAAVGCHGQTVRHRPQEGFTIQLNNPALLAELVRIDVVADFRSRDVAAGGQGAPLVPVFHEKIFASRSEDRAVLNIGGIANLSLLASDGPISGFDSGPGNMLMDALVQDRLGIPYDECGRIAASGRVDAALLEAALRDPYFSLPTPKSTGREYFSREWLEALAGGSDVRLEDLAATLAELTAASIVDALAASLPSARRLIVCGGGALNPYLMGRISHLASERIPGIQTCSSEAFGIDPMSVEGAAFAWLAWAFVNRVPGNSPSATKAAGPRILGALYPS